MSLVLTKSTIEIGLFEIGQIWPTLETLSPQIEFSTGRRDIMEDSICAKSTNVTHKKLTFFALI